MMWYHNNNSDNIRASKTNLKRHKRRNKFEQNSAKMCYEHLFFSFRNKYWRAIILAVLSAILLFAYYYNTMDVFMVHFKGASTTRPTETSKVLKNERSTIPSAMSTKVKSVTRLTNSRPKSASKVSAKGSPRTPSRSSRYSKLRNKKSSNPTSDTDCRMFSCFNYSRCPLTGRFAIYLYDLDVLYNGIDGITAPIREMLSENNYITSDPKEACLFLVIGELSYSGPEEKDLSQSYKFINEATLNTLPHWGRDGQNHLLLNLGYSTFTETTGSAMVAQTMFTHKYFRPGFDVVIPVSQGLIPIKGKVQSSSPMRLARRKFLLSFQGKLLSTRPQNEERDQLAKVLKDIGWGAINKFRIYFYCAEVDKLSENGIDDWGICLKRQLRIRTLNMSTFVLILAPSDYNYASTNLLQTRLYEALESGAIPIILGGDRIRLPFEEVLDWRRAVICLPTARVNNLIFLLENMADEDILAFRKHGRMLWERYFCTVQTSIDSLLAVIRTRLNIAPQPAKLGNESMFTFSFPKVGPQETLHNIPSKTFFKRNFTVGLLNAYEQWNLWGDPFVLYPQLPWDPILTPEARFLKKTVAKQFEDLCSPQAGDRPVEQFTVVILTYDRKAMLDKAIKSVSHLPYLNKIVVINNGPSKLASKDWPTTVPIVVVHASQNSINNRFVPFDLIETEAILSLDDDVVLEPKDIQFAFKVWRQHRDQIVGFFGRRIAWDFLNNVYRYSTSSGGSSNRGCLVHMVLTGAAFINRYYYSAYWRILPQSMRDLVDELKNCEDIAMNFLVAHIAKKPPIQVNWAEVANTSYKRLSNKKSHYIDRNKCMKHFAEVMGYTPLLTTLYSVLSLPAASSPRT